MDTYLLCRLCDRVVMIPEQVRRKLDAGQGHIVGQVAVHFPVEPVGQIGAAQVEAAVSVERVRSSFRCRLI